jgi:glycosidase
VWTKADLLALKLIDEVHKRKMRIIFDGVFNHIGARNFAFQDVEKNQQASPYRDWFIDRKLARQCQGNPVSIQGLVRCQDIARVPRGQQRASFQDRSNTSSMPRNAG